MSKFLIFYFVTLLLFVGVSWSLAQPKTSNIYPLVGIAFSSEEIGSRYPYQGRCPISWSQLSYSWPALLQKGKNE